MHNLDNSGNLLFTATFFFSCDKFTDKIENKIISHAPGKTGYRCIQRNSGPENEAHLERNSGQREKQMETVYTGAQNNKHLNPYYSL